MTRMLKRRFSFPIILLAVILIVLILHVWIDRLYELRLHVALGYGAVYSKNMTIELVSTYVGGLVYLAFGLWAARKYRQWVPLAVYRAIQILAAVIGWGFGCALWRLSAPDWFLFFNHQSFHRTDPIFGMDISFYVYQLPLIHGVVGRVVATLIVGLLSYVPVFIIDSVRKSGLVKTREQEASTRSTYRSVRVVFVLLGSLFLCFAVLTWLGRYELLYTAQNGTFLYGPDFVTVHWTIPVFSWIHIALLLFVAAACYRCSLRPERLFISAEARVVISFRSFRSLIYTFAGYLGSLVVSGVVGSLMNSLYVHPNQNTVELPFIQHTIDATRWSLGIEHVQNKNFQVDSTLTPDEVSQNQTVLANVRVNDQGQTTSIYNQLQSFKNYFTFTPASVDRYGGQEVYVSARELDVSKLPVPTWVNQTLVYTHGYGLAASPVNQFDQDGLPILIAKDTPQTTQAPIPTVTRPEIYFGLMDNDVIAPSKQGEFEYPVGNADKTSHYLGGFNLPVQGNRWLLALEQGSLKFYTSDQFTPNSEWLFDRNMYQRVEDIAPFLTYDSDAFPFVNSQGHILWMLDAYTEASEIPYAQSYMDTKYIRNSVKVVMDAYTGQTTFYVTDKSDPLIQSLMQVYPTLFTTVIPSDVAAHFRYPNDLFGTQAQALAQYHMTDPSAFYNQEDLWDMAQQVYQQNDTQARPPVYQMIGFPDSPQPQFVLSALFTPHQKQNLNGWLVANNEPGHYGELSLYSFPQSSLVFGPMQAENQIDSNPTISAQLTLWNQQGSRVVRGDLLLVPIGNTVLYIEPVYLVANRANSLPQLERVIVNYNKQVYIDTSLGAAIQDLLSNQVGTGDGAGTGIGVPGGGGTNLGGASATGGGVNQDQLIAEANQWFQKYQSDTAKGNLAAAGQDLQQLGQVLTQLKGLNTSK